MFKKILTEKNFKKLNEVIEENKEKKGCLMIILHEAQSIFGCVPLDVQNIISEELNMPLANIYGVVTFYSQFTLIPKGEYTISVCLGTACYVKGAQSIIDRIEKELNLEVGSTTKDGKFSLEATRCIGACGLAPILTINEEVYGNLKESDVKDILKDYL